MVERFHRQLKAVLCAHNRSDWTDTLPVVLLDKRNSIKEDMQCTPANLVFGMSPRLPADLVDEIPRPLPSTATYAHNLHQMLAAQKPFAPRPQHCGAYIHPSLSTAPFVLLRCDGVRRSLQPPYTGPFKVISRTDKTFIIDREGRHETVSIDRLKPAYYAESSRNVTPPTATQTAPTTASGSCAPQPVDIVLPTQPDSPMPTPPESPIPTPTPVTRSGRRVHFPARFLD